MLFVQLFFFTQVLACNNAAGLHIKYFDNCGTGFGSNNNRAVMNVCMCKGSMFLYTYLWLRMRRLPGENEKIIST